MAIYRLALAVHYCSSPEYFALSATSRNDYRRVIDGCLEEHGRRRGDQMKRKHVDAVIGKLAGEPGAGLVFVKEIGNVGPLWDSVAPTYVA